MRLNFVVLLICASACTLKPANLGNGSNIFGLQNAVNSNTSNSSGIIGGSTASSGGSTGIADTTGGTSGSSGSLGTIKVAISSSGSSSSVTINSAYAMAFSDPNLAYLRSVYGSTTFTGTKTELTTPQKCPVSGSGTSTPPCTLGSVSVSWGLCAEDQVTDSGTTAGANTYTTCIAAEVSSDATTPEYPTGTLNIAAGQFPTMGYDLPYTGYPIITRCEMRSGDTQNKPYSYSALATATTNGDMGSLDFVQFDAQAPSSANTNSPLLSFTLLGGQFVDMVDKTTTFNADITATNVPVLSIPACTP